MRIGTKLVFTVRAWDNVGPDQGPVKFDVLNHGPKWVELWKINEVRGRDREPAFWIRWRDLGAFSIMLDGAYIN
tara:strand:+ start:849 stop:1070 length:222 start_codon:yes stop_codon:yes gene_type:complete